MVLKQAQNISRTVIWLAFAAAILTGLPAAADDEPAASKAEATKPTKRGRTVRLDRAYRDAFDKFSSVIELIELPTTFSERLLREGVDRSLIRLALYRTGDRENKQLPARLYNAIEQALIDKVMATDRYDVIECAECRRTMRSQITLGLNKFSVEHEVESTGRLIQIGKDIGVQAFLLWDAIQEKNKVVINARLMRQDTGQIIWSKQYYRDIGRNIDFEIRAFLLGLGATRAPADDSTAAEASASMVLGVGARIDEETTLSPYVHYAYILDAFLNVSSRATIGILGITFAGELSLELDSLFGKRTEAGHWLTYASIGPVFVISGEVAPIFGWGIRLQLNRYNQISAGIVYTPSQSVDMTENADYANTVSFGGFGYSLQLGLRF